MPIFKSKNDEKRCVFNKTTINDEIIFDFDGVILDSNNAKKDAFIECYQDLNDNLKEKIESIT